MQDTNEMQNTQNEQGAVPQNPPYANEGMSPEEKRAESYKVRLSKARQEAEEEAKRADKLAKRLEDLQKKFESGKANTNESSDYVTSENKIREAQQQGISPDDIPYIIEDHMQNQSLKQKMDVAMEKDPELVALMNSPDASRNVSPQALTSFKYLDNAPAVFKHLLKDKADLMVFKAAQEEYALTGSSVSYYQFLSNLSKKLKKSESFPHPSQYEETANLSNVGGSEVFDSADYIRSKYK